MPKSPTVEDVARVAGVSRQTVSNVLNTPSIVKGSTRERVETAIVELGYRPHAAARMLRTRRSSTIGIHLDPYAGGVSGVVLDRFIHALTERASDRGMRMLVYAARTAEEELSRLADLTDGAEIDAVVITGTFYGDPRTRWLNERNVPFVSFGRPWGDDDVAQPSHPWVDVDGAAGTRAATDHALSVAGRHVAFLGWPSGSGTGDDRERGWREGMDAAGASGRRYTAVDDVAQAREAVVTALVQREADAVVCASDSLAIGVHLAAIEAGIPRLPVIGFDNTPAVEALGISSVEQLPEQVATGTLELLMGPTGTVVAPHPEGLAHVLVTPELIVR
jgi:DNA-binding LacI/PurR family transcriptional regulator